MAKRTSRRRSVTLPMATLLGIGAPILMEKDNMLAGNWNAVATNLAWKFTGFNMGTGQFDPKGLMYGALPAVIGVMISKFVGGNLGVNRKLGQAGVPLLRL